MDNLVSLYTTLDGRISRRQFWLGILGLIVAGIVLSLLLGLIGLPVMPNMGPPGTLDREALAAWAQEASRAGGWGGLISFLIFVYPAYALQIKRRHDRNNSGLDVKIYVALSALLVLLQALRIGFVDTELPGLGVTVPLPGMPLQILGGLVGIFAIYLLVVLGFLRGTAGPNDYGADPTGRAVEPA